MQQQATILTVAAVVAVALTPAAMAGHGSWTQSGTGIGPVPVRDDPCEQSPVQIGGSLVGIPDDFADGTHTLDVFTDGTLRVDVTFYAQTDGSCEELGDGGASCPALIGCDEVNAVIPDGADLLVFEFTGAGQYTFTAR